MFGYALRRLILASPLLVGITFVSFLVIHLAPGEPVEQQAGELGPEPLVALQLRGKSALQAGGVSDRLRFVSR